LSISSDESYLVHDGRELELDKTLADYRIGANQTLHLELRLRCSGTSAMLLKPASLDVPLHGREAIAIFSELLTEVSSSSFFMYSRAVEDGTPCVLRRAGLALPVVQQISDPKLWTQDGRGSVEVPVSLLHSCARSGPPFKAVQMPLSQYMDEHMKTTEAEPRLYLQQLPLEDYPLLKAWLGQLEVPFGLQPDYFAASIFAGPAGVTTPLQYDGKHDASPLDNLFIQCSGRKRFDLWRPADHAVLYARGEPLPATQSGLDQRRATATTEEDLQAEPLSESPHVSRICDLESAALPESESAWPRFRQAHARRLSVVLEAGDALYIPRWWWHKSYSLEAGTSINWLFAWDESADSDRS
jgi:hypothetical protein